MKTAQLKDWLANFKKAWEDNDAEKAAALFSEDVVYFESPLEESCKDWKAVSELWKVVPENQKDVAFTYEIVSSDKEIAVVNWKLSRIKLPGNEHEFIDGIFLLSLNEDGFCNFLKQWRASKII